MCSKVTVVTLVSLFLIGYVLCQDDSQPVATCTEGCICSSVRTRVSDTRNVVHGKRVKCHNPDIANLLTTSALPMDTLQLDVSDNLLTTITASMFSGLTLLERLNLSGNSITQIEDGAFDSMENLRMIDLSRNRLLCDCHLRWFFSWIRQRDVHVTPDTVCHMPDQLKNVQLRKLKRKDLHCDWPTREPVFELSPSVNQIVFAGDRLTFHCKVSNVELNSKLTWVRNEHHLVEENSKEKQDDEGSTVSVVTEYLPDHNEVVSSLLIPRLEASHGGEWTCRVNGPRRNDSKSVAIVVIAETTKHCEHKVTNGNKGKYIWTRTVVGVTVELPCEGSVKNHNLGTTGFYYRPPHASFKCDDSGEWVNLDTSACPYVREVTKVLEQFSKANLFSTKTGILDNSRRLLNYTGDGSRLRDSADVLYVIKTVENFLEFVPEQPEISGVLLDIVAILSRIDKVVLHRAQLEANASMRILTIVERLSSLVGNDNMISRYEDSLRVEDYVVDRRPSDTTGVLNCFWRQIPHRIIQMIENRKLFRCDFVTNRNPKSAFDNKKISIELPISALESVEQEIFQNGSVEQPSYKFQFIVFKDSGLFVTGSAQPEIGAKTVQKRSAGFNSNVFGVKIVDFNSENFSFPVTISFKVDSDAASFIPFWWDQSLNNKTGGWSKNDCVSKTVESKTVVFECSQLGYYTLFLDAEASDLVSGQECLMEFEFTNPLVITYIGSAIFMYTMLITIFVYLLAFRSIKMPRKTKHSLLNSWVALWLLCLVFTVGTFKIDNMVLCRAVGLGLHCLTLNCLLWMLISFSNIYKLLTKPVVANPIVIGRKPVMRLYVIGWGIPMIVCGVSGAINTDFYGTDNSCLPSFTASLVALFGPAGIILNFILVFLMLAHCKIYGSNGKSSTDMDRSGDLMAYCRSQTQGSFASTATCLEDTEHSFKLQLNLHFTTLVLFLTTWTLGAITITKPFSYYQNGDHVFACFYCVTLAVFGFYIFAFYVWMRRDARVWCRQLVKCRDRRNVYNTDVPQPTMLPVNAIRHSTSLASVFTTKSGNTASIIIPSDKHFDVLPPLPKCNFGDKNSDGTLPANGFGYVQTFGEGQQLFFNPVQNGIARRFFEKNRFQQQQFRVLQDCRTQPNLYDGTQPTVYDGTQPLMYDEAKPNEENLYENDAKEFHVYEPKVPEFHSVMRTKEPMVTSRPTSPEVSTANIVHLRKNNGGSHLRKQKRSNSARRSRGSSRTHSTGTSEGRPGSGLSKSSKSDGCMDFDSDCDKPRCQFERRRNCREKSVKSSESINHRERKVRSPLRNGAMTLGAVYSRAYDDVVYEGGVVGGSKSQNERSDSENEQESLLPGNNYESVENLASSDSEDRHKRETSV